MGKRTVIGIFALFMCVSAFAQTEPKKVLSAEDVDAFIVNQVAIQTDLEALGDKYNDYFQLPEGDAETAADGNIADSINRLRSVKIPDEVQEIMRKHGLGDNGFEKYIVISYCFGALYFDQMINMRFSGQTLNPEMQAYMDQMKAGVEQMKASVHANDLALVSTRLADLAAVLGDGEQ